MSAQSNLKLVVTETVRLFAKFPRWSKQIQYACLVIAALGMASSGFVTQVS